MLKVQSKGGILLVGLFTFSTGCLSRGSTGSGNTLTKDALTPDTHSDFLITSASKHGALTCNDCHGAFDTFKGFSCIDCHEHAEATVTSNHVGVSGFVYDSAGCYSCHPTGEASGNLNHDTFFPTSTGTVHADLACTTCHIDSTNRKVLGCITCHSHEQTVTDTHHSGIPGYSYTSASCYSCHPDGTAAGATINHAELFPIGTGTTHSMAVCADCHTDAADRKVFSCLTCHQHEQTVTNSNHASVSGYSYDSASCYSCHPKGTATSVDHEPIFLIGTGTKHENAACSSCHTDSANRSVVSCIGAGCHPQSTMSSAHSNVRAGTAGYLWTTNDCLACHSTPSVFRVSNHNNCVNHERAKCRTCHNSVLSSKPFVASDFSKQSCTACHSNRGTNCND